MKKYLKLIIVLIVLYCIYTLIHGGIGCYKYINELKEQYEFGYIKYGYKYKEYIEEVNNASHRAEKEERQSRAVETRIPRCRQ